MSFVEVLLAMPMTEVNYSRGWDCLNNRTVLAFGNWEFVVDRLHSPWIHADRGPENHFFVTLDGWKTRTAERESIQVLREKATIGATPNGKRPYVLVDSFEAFLALCT